MRSAIKHVKNAKGEIEYSIGSGNVFADLGLPNAEQLLAKAELTFQIAQIIEQRGLTQAQAAKVLGIDQPKVSALVRGKVLSVSMERLYRYLNALGSDVEIVIRHRPRKRTPGAVRVITPAAANTAHPGRKPKTTIRRKRTGRLKKEGTTR